VLPVTRGRIKKEILWSTEGYYVNDDGLSLLEMKKKNEKKKKKERERNRALNPTIYLRDEDSRKEEKRRRQVTQ
jgi:hypothetical protein